MRPPNNRQQRGGRQPRSNQTRYNDQWYEPYNYSGYGQNWRGGPNKRPDDVGGYPQGTSGPNGGFRRNQAPQPEYREYDGHPDHRWQGPSRYNSDPYQDYKPAFDQDDPDDYEQQYNVPVSNQFFPLRDNDSPRRVNPPIPPSNMGQQRELVIDGRNPLTQGTQSYPGWGFPKANQGVKRPAEPAEAQGQGDISSLKRPKT